MCCDVGSAFYLFYFLLRERERETPLALSLSLLFFLTLSLTPFLFLFPFLLSLSSSSFLFLYCITVPREHGALCKTALTLTQGSNGSVGMHQMPRIQIYKYKYERKYMPGLIMAIRVKHCNRSVWNITLVYATGGSLFWMLAWELKPFCWFGQKLCQQLRFCGVRKGFKASFTLFFPKARKSGTLQLVVEFFWTSFCIWRKAHQE